MSMTDNGDVRMVDAGGGVELETRVIGTGEPVVLIHGSLIADAFAPLLRETALTDRFQTDQLPSSRVPGQHPPGPSAVDRGLGR
jgi:hypothetical protein